MDAAYIDPESLGASTGPVAVGWTRDETLLYALGVGAGRGRVEDLAYVTENTSSFPHRVLPTFATVIALRAGRPEIGRYPYGALVHASQDVLLHRPLPSYLERAIGTTVVTNLVDRSPGCFVTYETLVTDGPERFTFFTSRATVLIRGVYSGRAGSSTSPAGPPNTPHDFATMLTIRPEQALLYRLSGDRNRLHSDPTYARDAGFSNPILHGLCTFGTASHRIHTIYEEPVELTRVSARFSRPAYPGEELELRAWTGASSVAFDVLNSAGDKVLTDGLWEFSRAGS